MINSLITSTNKMRGMARVGFLVKSVRGGFVYAAAGDTPVGVIVKPAIRGRQAEIQTTGEAKVFVDETVPAGVELRMAVSGEGGRIGSARAIGTAEDYVSIGTTLGAGKGLVSVALNIKPSGGGGGGGIPEAPIDGTQYGRQNAAWTAVTAGIPDAPFSGSPPGGSPPAIAYARYNGNWVNSGLVLDYSGGTGTMLDTINYGETLTFNASGDLTVGYDPVNNIITYGHTPSAVYSDWKLYMDSVEQASITSGAYANWAGGTGIDLAFTAPGSPPMNTINVSIDQTWLSGAYYTQSAVDTLIANFITDAPADNVGYARRNNAWVNSGLVISYAGGTLTDQINYGETLGFLSAGTGLGVSYNATTNEVTYTFTPSGSYYSGWLIEGDAGTAKTNVTQAGEVDFVGGTYVNTSLAFTPGSPPQYDLTIDVDTAALSSVFYTQGAVDSLISGFISDAVSDGNIYGRVNGAWQNAGLVLSYGGGVFTDQINYGETIEFLAAGTGLGVSYNPTTNQVTYTYTPTGSSYSGWLIEGDAGTAKTNVTQAGEVDFVGGTNINTSLAFTPGSPPQYDLTINLDSNISITTATASSYLRVDNGSYHINVGAETISFTRNSSNYFRASTVGGNFSFVTNGRTGAYAEAMLFVGAAYVDLKYGTGTTTALKLRTSSTGVDVTGTVKATHIPSEVGLIASASSSTSNGGRLRLENTSTSQATGTKAGRIEFYKADGSTQGAGVVGEIYTIAIDAGGTYNMYFTTGQDVETPLGSNGTMYLDYLGTLHVSTLQSSGHVRASTYFRSDNTAAVLGTASAGTVYLRPNGYSSATYEVNANSSRLYSSTAIQSASEITAYSSDGRLKNNVRRIPNALDIVCSVDGVLYNWNDDVDKYGFTPTRKSDVGFIAQNFGQHIIGGSAFAPFDRDVDGNSISGQDFLTVKPEKVIPYLVEAIKELREILEENGIRIK